MNYCTLEEMNEDDDNKKVDEEAALGLSLTEQVTPMMQLKSDLTYHY